MTSSATARTRGRVFDQIAEEYDRERPAYPDPLVDRACRSARLRAGDRVLEVGCGTGQLTQSLVARGLRVTAVDPGANLLALARRRPQGPGRAEFVNARFEDARLPAAPFRAVFSACAFHWTDPDVSWSRAADLLAPGGTLALISYLGLDEESSRADHAALLDGLRRVAPDVAATWPPLRDLAALQAAVVERRANVSEVWSWLAGCDMGRAHAGARFCETEFAAWPRVIEQDAATLTALLGTLSFWAGLTLAQRTAIEREHRMLEARLGRPIRSGVVDVLVTARTPGP